jgi:putative endopeptidase
LTSLSVWFAVLLTFILLLDDEGVQWNSKGGLEQWMTDKSLVAFKKMAGCVVKEYGSFCPLDAAQYTPNCLNGANTQGENIADNGGENFSSNVCP